MLQGTIFVFASKNKNINLLLLNSETTFSKFDIALIHNKKPIKAFMQGASVDVYASPLNGYIHL